MKPQKVQKVGYSGNARPGSRTRGRPSSATTPNNQSSSPSSEEDEESDNNSGDDFKPPVEDAIYTSEEEDDDEPVILNQEIVGMSQNLIKTQKSEKIPRLLEIPQLKAKGLPRKARMAKAVPKTSKPVPKLEYIPNPLFQNQQATSNSRPDLMEIAKNMNRTALDTLNLNKQQYKQYQYPDPPK